MATCLIALGSNLGDRLTQLRSAVSVLRHDPEVAVKHISPLYETAPVGGPEDQGAYLNAAAIIETELPADKLLARLHEVEAMHERERLVRWGARTLDLDLLTYDEFVSDQETLELPHPRMHQRRFVMVPVCDIAADMVHPQLQRTMQELLKELPIEPGDLTLFESNWAD